MELVASLGEQPPRAEVLGETRRCVSVRHNFEHSLIEVLVRGSPVAYLQYHVQEGGVYISLMAIFKPFRKRGLSKVLLNEAFAHYSASGLNEVELFSYPLDEEEPAAVQSERLSALYKRYGFRANQREARPQSGPGRYLCRT